MKTKRLLCPVVAAIGIALVMAVSTSGALASQATGEAIRIDSDDIGGVVTGPKGPEAGVWVIAETTGLPTKFAKIVVTDDRGRYVIPDLPKANYTVWSRGYGLVDGAKVQTAPGQLVNLTAVTAPSATAAAQYYPAIYWYAMLKIPDKGQFSGPQRDENMPENLTDQAQWLSVIKTTNCIACHAIGTIGTRTIPKELGHFNSSAEAWERRIQSGQAMTGMVNAINRLDSKLAFQLIALTI